LQRQVKWQVSVGGVVIKHNIVIRDDESAKADFTISYPESAGMREHGLEESLCLPCHVGT